MKRHHSFSGKDDVVLVVVTDICDALGRYQVVEFYNPIRVDDF